ncbi:predicted protein, partial [Nematostella vectensis]
FRIEKTTFEGFVRLVDPYMAKEDTKMREAIPVPKRVAVALWRLATGNSYRTTSLQFGIGRSTSMHITHEFCRIIASLA